MKRLFFQFIPVIAGLLILQASPVHCQESCKKLYEVARPVVRPEGAPKASDVIMRNLSPHPVDDNDSYNSMEAMDAFHVTRLEWTYTQSSSFIDQVKASGRVFGGAINNSSFHPDYRTEPDWIREYGIVDLNGDPVVAPHMRGWGERLHGCVNDSVFEEGYMAYFKGYIDAGADVMQRDDPNANLSATNWGACFCENCMPKFREYLADHSTIQERISWGIDTLETFNYRSYLLALGAPVGDEFRTWDGGKLKELFVRFNTESTLDFHRRTRLAMNEYAGTSKTGAKYPMSCNNGVRRWKDVELEFDWAFGELSYRDATPEYLYSAIRKANRFDRIQVITMPKKGDYENLEEWERLTRQTIATAYSCGSLCMVPWDVYMPNDAPRYFGTPGQYADLYQFVQDHAGYFEEYENAAYSIPYKSDLRHPDKLPVEWVTGEDISAFARAKPAQSDAPVVVHLVDWSVAPKPFTLSLANDLFFGNFDLDITLFQPDGSEVSPPTTTIGDRTQVEIPALTPWGFLVVSAGEYSGRPRVWMTRPTAADSFAANSNIPIEAAASDSLGWITKVEFYLDTLKIGEDDSEPYSFLWEDVPAGWYTIRSKATNNRDLWSTSSMKIRVGSVYEADTCFVGHWKMDEQSGPIAKDASPNGYKGYFYGEPAWADGRIGGAAELDGKTGFIQVPDNNDLDIDTGDFSISLWFRRYDNDTPNLRLLSKGAGSDSHAGYCLFGSNTGMSAAVGNGEKRIFAYATHPALEEWTHLVMSVERGESVLLFINGVLSGSAEISEFDGQDLSSSFRFFIGQHESGSLRWHGMVDDVRLYKRALGEAEIDRLSQMSTTVTGIHHEFDLGKKGGSPPGLSPNYPNPFSSETTIPLRLHKPARVRLSVISVTGQQIALLVDGLLDSGHHEITWNGRDSQGNPAGSGVYFIRMQAGGSVVTHKMLLLK